ncbi:mediator of DNA damage checkpoint protein 1-like isoform X2 [Cucumis sativus]|uniref:mediator of DNA damage checkpoint protein 1-like isoform X2 n=1 Tax=Cucumis sativus TaxID=3659 RepID=UPI0012F4BDE4|nr:mediator of DNA damage checkpoint protein 1-like isoform X2 [Cucumis sativus]
MWLQAYQCALAHNFYYILLLKLQVNCKLLRAWIVSSSWLKESYQEGIFVDELPYILNDDDYISKYRASLKAAVLRAKACPGVLFEGYDICISAHAQPPPKTLSLIVKSAGGNVGSLHFSLKKKLK